VNGRVLATAVFAGGGAVAIWVWLSSRPDSELSRWASIGVVVACVFGVLTLVVTVIPLIRASSDEEQGEPNKADGRRPRAVDGVSQEINNYGSGTVNVQGRGSQLNVDRRRQRGDRR
jgi:predicted RND superfamily exporter protein